MKCRHTKRKSVPTQRPNEDVISESWIKAFDEIETFQKIEAFQKNTKKGPHHRSDTELDAALRSLKGTGLRKGCGGHVVQVQGAVSPTARR